MRSLLLLVLAATLGWTLPATPAPRSVALSVDTLVIVPTADTLVIRTSDTVSARIADSLGRAVRNQITWTSRDTAVLSVRTVRQTLGVSRATVRARADTGRTYLVAAAGALKDSMLWVVRDTVCSTTALGSLNAVPDSMTARRTDSLGVAVFAKNGCGTYRHGINVVWSSSDSAKATITRLDSLIGRIVALDSSGTVYIKAVSGTKRDSVKLKLKTAP